MTCADDAVCAVVGTRTDHELKSMFAKLESFDIAIFRDK